MLTGSKTNVAIILKVKKKNLRFKLKYIVLILYFGFND